MARTRLFRLVRSALRAHGAGAPRAVSRRSFLVMSAALAACSGGLRRRRDIAIVGGGVAGLTAAYRLARAGQDVTLYEASGRLGGRMFTRRNFNEDGQYCELGGELVDSNHSALRSLAEEVGVGIQRIAPEGAEEFYHIGGRLRTQRDMIDPGRGQGAFARLAAHIAEDQEGLLDAEENWTAHARELDATSLQAYLRRTGNLAPRWALEVLDIAYRGEFGLNTAEQSALNLVDFIGTDPRQGFQIFGESDEAYRIAGGSSALPEALVARLGGTAQHMRHALVSIARTPRGVRLVFDAPDGRIEREHAFAVLAAPFTKLRTVEGLDALGLGKDKLRAIHELGYGDNSKLMVSTRSRPWRDARWPAASAGVFYSDRAQLIWETSRAQDGERGILTNYLQGRSDRTAALAGLRAGLRAFSPESAAALDESKASFMAWVRQPFALGSYSAPRVGQYTTLLEHTATPSEDGRIHFAGEHTSTDFMGFMNGAVESGERVAEALIV